MSETPQGRRKNVPPPKTPEQIDIENSYYRKQVCPCEEAEPESASEYEVPGEWVTYTGEVNQSIMEYAARHAEHEMRKILKNSQDTNDEHAEQHSDSSSDDESCPRRSEVCALQTTQRID